MVVLKDPYTAMMDNLPVDCDGTELERILEDLSYDSFKLEKEGRKSKGKDGCMEVMMMFHNYNCRGLNVHNVHQKQCFLHVQ